jgi:hypothetical protein
MDSLEIHPGIGIGPIQLGMHPQRVVSLFHEKEVYESWMGGNLNDAILYHGMRLHFDKCTGAGPLPGARLNWIVIHQREDACLFDRHMDEWTKDGIFARLTDEGYSPIKVDNGDIDVVRPYLGMSFDANGKLIWLETA